MFHRHVGLKILFLLASSRVASSQFPPPLIYLEMPSNSLTEGESVKIPCVAPRAYAGAYFYFFMVGQTQPVQMLPAPEAQHRVTFLLENVTTSNTGLYRCQYGVFNGSQLQPSALSNMLEITVEAFGLSTFPPTSSPGPGCQDTSWILLTALCVTGVVLLVMTLVVAVMAFGRFKERQKKKKERDSCWTEGRRCTTEQHGYPPESIQILGDLQAPSAGWKAYRTPNVPELSFDNCVFTVSLKKTDQEAAEGQDAQIFSAQSIRHVSGSYLEQPDFFTFRASE